jgi:hypothetical protein
MAARKAPEQASIEDDAKARRDEAIVRRLETMRNLVLDLEARLPGMRRELDALIEELRAR